ncbi:MAG TPA: alpha-amylase family glycosyl hydrolase, partial [Pirellulales bacterium]|nr:alpha-amylase family glycosyl hydrolase [Pirellulales bacterium]
MVTWGQPMEGNLLGAMIQDDGDTRFRVWAPTIERVELRLVDPARSHVLLSRMDDGYHETVVAGLRPGTTYFYRLNSAVDRPDPASRFQPQGVHGPSGIVPRDFSWTDSAWHGVAWQEYVIYEAHVGTMTPTGTFGAIMGQLDDLVRLGVTALQLMPIAQFPGGRNWGYDAVHPFAVQNTYGGPHELKKLIDACHARGLAVVLDVVYNHLGPEGNYLAEFGPYFTDAYRTPWGPAINFDGPDSGPVRDFFIANARQWFEEFHVDGLRLDATHAIHDASPCHFLRELADQVHSLSTRLNRPLILIAESNANDPRVVRCAEHDGHGIDAQIVDDFHRALHARLTGERQGFYTDFGSLQDVAKAYQDGFVLTGQYSR